jgi:hypothetical protein
MARNRKSPTWTNEQIEYLKKHYCDTDTKLLVKYFNKRKETIVSKANSFGLKKNPLFSYKLKVKNNPGTYFSPEEIKYLKDNYDLKSYTEISKELNKTTKSIVKKIKKLGLVKTKKGKENIKTRNNKTRGRDLSNINMIREIALKYNTRNEFWIYDQSAFRAAIRNGIYDEITKHMVIKNFSIPQLMLKDLLEHILGVKCSYNDRTVIKPYEIDCYFSKWKIGWEYDGKRYHETDISKNRSVTKTRKCIKQGICLFAINELTDNYRKYEENIKQQLIAQITEINKRTGYNITKNDILTYTPKIIYPNLLTTEEKQIVSGKTMSEIKIVDVGLYKKIKKYKFYLNEDLRIINDLKTNRKPIRTFEEYVQYLKNKGYKNYSDFASKEHSKRVMERLKTPLALLKQKFNSN